MVKHDIKQMVTQRPEVKQVVTQKPVVMEEAIKQVVPRGLRWWRRGRSR